jgi:predicted SprT family Zn-dependent metalloprotease
MSQQEKPTFKFYGLFQYIFDHYNDTLFDNQIKDCIISITRKKDCFGHFVPKRFFHANDHETDELALNPTMFVKFPLIEICQTIVHEMVHAWQEYHGTPSRAGYHNKEFADKMIYVGLMPSSTGEPGGKTVGQSMADYPIKGGRFLEVSEELMNNQIFEGLYYEVNPLVLQSVDTNRPLYDQIKDLILSPEDNIIKPNATKKTKIKYSCDCSNVWGKPELQLHCKGCDKDMLPAA